ncbi:MAG: DUF3810 domain-containing protein [Eubacteriaceae bacterium]
MKKFLLKRLLFILLGVTAYIVTKYAQYNPDWTEQVYSRLVYHGISNVVGFLPSMVSFSVTEWLVTFFLLFCLGYIVYYVRKALISKDEPGMTAYRGVAGAAAIFCMMYFSFTALGGLNYHRYTFSYYTGYYVEQSSVEELEQMCTSLADDIGRVREQLGEDTDLFAPGPGDFDYYAQRSVLAMQMLAEQYPSLDRSIYSTPKPVVMSELMSHAGIAGVFFPFTMESNINVNVPFFMLPATMAHELAHQCGFMREDEANFIAFLACEQLDEPMMLYSGLFLAFDHSISALEEVDPELASEIMCGLSQAALHDMAQYDQFCIQYEGIISNISSTVNDIYLKANNQTDGVYSYDRMVDLLLAEQRAAVGQPAGAQGAVR